MNQDQLVAALSTARDHLAAHGWTQGVFRDPGGGCCLRGAVRVTLMGAGATAVIHNHQLSSTDYAVVNEAEQFMNHAVAETLGDETVLKAFFRSGREFYSVPCNGGGMEAVAYYNDEVLTDKDDALAFMDKLIIRAQEKA